MLGAAHAIPAVVNHGVCDVVGRSDPDRTSRSAFGGRFQLRLYLAVMLFLLSVVCLRK